jgi:hypothetical protein
LFALIELGGGSLFGADDNFGFGSEPILHVVAVLPAACLVEFIGAISDISRRLRDEFVSMLKGILLIGSFGTAIPPYLMSRGGANLPRQLGWSYFVEADNSERIADSECNQCPILVQPGTPEAINREELVTPISRTNSLDGCCCIGAA